MTKPRSKKPVTLPQGDIGPDTPAQMAGAVVLSIVEDSGAEFLRKRKDHALEIMAGSKHLNGKPKKPEISARQCAAGLELHGLWCTTFKTGDAPFTKVFVDTSPNPAAVALMKAERVTKYKNLKEHIPKALLGPIGHVVLKGQLLLDGYSRDEKEALCHTAMLQVALDILGNELGI